MSETPAPAAAAPTPAAPNAAPTLATMTADQITEGLRNNQISGFQRGDALTRLASLLKGETPAVEQKLTIQQFPTAADQGDAEAAAANAGEVATGAYAPAKTPADYEIPIDPHPSRELLEDDSIVRASLHQAEMPVVTGNAVSKAMYLAAVKHENSSETQLQSYGVNEGQALRQLWGENFTARVQAVEAYLNELGGKIPFVSLLLADPRARYCLSDRRVVTALSQMLEGRANKI